MSKRGYNSRRSLSEWRDDGFEVVRRWLADLPQGVAVALIALFSVVGLGLVAFLLYLHHPSLY